MANDMDGAGAERAQGKPGPRRFMVPEGAGEQIAALSRDLEVAQAALQTAVDAGRQHLAALQRDRDVRMAAVRDALGIDPALKLNFTRDGELRQWVFEERVAPSQPGGAP